MNIEKMERVICDEIDKIADKGLTTSNLDNANKLIKMAKNLKTYEAMEMDGYSNGYDMEYPMARRGQHYVRGHYSRNDGYDNAYDDYMSAKNDYRRNRSAEANHRMMNGVHSVADSFENRLDEMWRDADTADERKMIERYKDAIHKAR